jgi:hypothetical protein
MFRFTIRDVLWLTVVVALAFAWWMNRAQLMGMAEYRDSIVDQLTRHLHEVEGVMFEYHPDGILVYKSGSDDGQSYWYPFKPESKHPGPASD